jgi:hypothetical protein
MIHPINEALIKIVGVFAYEHKKHIPLFQSGQYESMDLIDLPKIILEKGKSARQSAIEGTRANYKNTYYAEFRDFMFTGKDQDQVDGYQKNQIRTFQRKKSLSGNFQHKKFDPAIRDFVEAPSIPFASERQEIFLFPGGIGMFAMILKPQENTLESISELINKARTFESKVVQTGEPIEFQKWISKEVLCGIPLTGDKLELDEFSGSKFKVYSVIDMPPSSDSFQYNRDHLLYEMGTCSPLGVVGTGHRLSPSDSYYDDLMENKVSAFRNYECLALLDSFTVIGHGNYVSFSDESETYVPHHQWNRVYFGIYIYNLFVRYSLFKFNAKFLSNPVKYRDDFQDFLNHYNLKYISFNFLPNLIFTKVREALSIEEEIDTFEKRLGNLATSIQEQQEKRQAFLLTIISVISAAEAVEGIFSGLNQVQEKLGWSSLAFYFILILILLTAAYFVLGYLFPLHAQKLKRKMQKFFEKKGAKNE